MKLGGNTALTPLPVKKTSIYVYMKSNIFTYILLLPALAFTFVFSYAPMPGILTAFQDFNIFKGLLQSPWAASYGFAHILDVVRLPLFSGSILNTLKLSVVNLVIGFPAPIIFALMLNELKGRFFKKTIQTVSYLPYFLSWIAVVGFAQTILDKYGPVNDLFQLIWPGRERTLFLSQQNLFLPFLVTLNLWKNLGWNSIIYLAAISGIDSQLYEASDIDGANKFQQLIHITLPSISQTIIILLIFNLGTLFASNFELVYGLQNAFINFEVIDTVVYKSGIQTGDYSAATAVSFTQGLVAFVLTFAANKLSKKISGVGIF